MTFAESFVAFVAFLVIAIIIEATYGDQPWWK